MKPQYDYMKPHMSVKNCSSQSTAEKTKMLLTTLIKLDLMHQCIKSQ